MAYPVLIGTLSSSCIGLVWGWLIGRLGYRLQKPIITLLSVLLSTMIIAAQVMLFLGRIRLSFFFVAVLVAFFVHIRWRGKMIQREGS